MKTYRTGTLDVTVLKGVSIDIPKGQFVAIMGRSGAGKSTLLYQLGLLDRPTAGTITLDGADTAALSRKEREVMRLTRLGYIFQDYALLPELTAIENVALPMLMQGASASVAYKHATVSLERIGLSNRLTNLPSQLSGGEQQRVSIARAIAHNPAILFADEPTASLDTENSETIMKILKELRADGQTIVMVTHEPEYGRLTDRIITLNDGIVVSDEHARR
jgi:putative ABC transport system ATP-binding protein